MMDDSALWGIEPKKYDALPEFSTKSQSLPKNGWQVARDMADWMAGQDRVIALKHIDRMEAIYKESKPNA